MITKLILTEKTKQKRKKEKEKKANSMQYVDSKKESAFTSLTS